MPVSSSNALTSIFDDQATNELKERQRLEELKRQAKVQQVKLDKRLNKQKILMGAFLGQVLVTEGESEQMIREYFAIHFPDFLTRVSDKHLFKSMVESLGGDMGLDEEKDSFEPRKNKNRQYSADETMSVNQGAIGKSPQEKYDTTANNGSLDLSSDEENNQHYRG